MGKRVLMGLTFFPRGGSAHVANNLARALPASGWEVRVVSGSGEPPGDAREFYEGLDLVAVDMTAAARATDPMAADPPMHGSYEDREGAPDRVFAALDDAAYEHQVDAWADVLEQAGAPDHDVLHLHHLTPLNAAAQRVAPGVPVVGHLHGTELLMLEEPAGRWSHLEAWRERMRGWAQRCERLIVLSPSHVDRAERVLGIDPRRCDVVANGFDPEIFQPRHVDRLEFWHEHLVREPRGWAPGEAPGSVRYEHEDLGGFAADGPVILYVGRFTAVKRLPLLIEAHALGRPRFARRAPLVVLGGFPGEWENEHPWETIRRTGAKDVFLAGWHTHRRLSEFLSAADVVVLPSVREQFGQVLVEGMACGLPAIAVDAHGPADIVRQGDTGWLVPPDDAPALAEALVAAVNEPAERIRRGRAASDDAHARFAWPALADRVAEVYDEAAKRGDLAVA
jgi:glycosyltransferase involved in cell wall biosynthesis